MNYPTTDNECTMMGWIEYIIYSNDLTMNAHVSIAPDADIDSTINVFSHDEQCMMQVHGWVWKWERVDGTY